MIDLSRIHINYVTSSDSRELFSTKNNQRFLDHQCLLMLLITINQTNPYKNDQT